MSDLVERMKSAVAEAEVFVPAKAMDTVRDGIETIAVPASRFADAAKWLSENRYTRFIDVTVVDDPDRELRFEIQLVVYSMEDKRWVRVKTRTDSKVPSVTPIYVGAHNYEREAFDLFGVVFDGHPQLTRIMLPDGWDGHPLRRDAPQPLEPTDFTVTRDLYKT
jgi:NADH-quinone oxidoreductase subunit C